MVIVDKWHDYEIIDSGNGEKLERWNNFYLRRPDPESLWNKNKDIDWNKFDGFYHRSNEGGGFWEFKNKLPEYWTVSYDNLTFKVSPTNFKHTGLFPEQAYNWDFMINKIKNEKREIKVLNLFAYTGGATIACSSAGAEVTHVDAAKGMVLWAKENANLSHLENNKIRFIVDDVLKFVLREQRRGNKYDAIIMDPPSYGRGPNKEIWHFEDSIFNLVEETNKLLSDDPLFFLINSYTTGISNIVLNNVLKQTVLKKFSKGKIFSDEIGLPIKNSNIILPCGIFARWEK